MEITDQIGKSLSPERPPKRIISLVPSITYSLSSFGLDEQVKGITRFCKYPSKWRKTKIIIGGTKNLKIDRIKDLKPDLILASKEENNKQEIEKLQEVSPVYVSDVKDFETNIQFIKDLGFLLSKEERADNFILSIQSKRRKLLNSKGNSAVYLIWKEPWMTIGGDTFINNMLNEAGFKNMYGDLKRYPSINLDDIILKKPDLLFLSSEPYPFKEKHKRELQKILPNTIIILVDGEAFSWFGTYPIKAYDYLMNLKTQV